MQVEHRDVREETSGHRAAVRRVNEAAFGGPAEADLVDCLREAGRFIASLVAVRDGAVVGHILFTPVTIERGDSRRRVALPQPRHVCRTDAGRDRTRLVDSGIPARRRTGASRTR